MCANSTPKAKAAPTRSCERISASTENRQSRNSLLSKWNFHEQFPLVDSNSWISFFISGNRAVFTDKFIETKLRRASNPRHNQLRSQKLGERKMTFWKAFRHASRCPLWNMESDFAWWIRELFHYQDAVYIDAVRKIHRWLIASPKKFRFDCESKEKFHSPMPIQTGMCRRLPR